jgi:hypothetical protein
VTDFGSSLAQLQFASTGNEDTRTFHGKPLRGAKAYTRTTAGDNGNFAFKFLAH